MVDSLRVWVGKVEMRLRCSGGELLDALERGRQRLLALLGPRRALRVNELDVVDPMKPRNRRRNALCRSASVPA